jgi:L-2-hydroxycarboxylate dehydrogenase (NAD+)
MPERYYIVPEECHRELVSALFLRRGYNTEEAFDMARLCGEAARHGIRTHNAVKALHLDDLFGSKVGGCRPGAVVEERPCRFEASRIWNANGKLGPSVAYQAIDVAIRLAEKFGVGMVSVDNACHYLWGGAYALEAARRGFIGYTQCTAMLAEVVPFGGCSPTLGTNPHTWAFPTAEAVGFPVLVDWATSVVSMGRIQQLKREGKPVPPDAAVDAQGRATADPDAVRGLLPFGGHKGYGLGLIDELVAALIGGSLPTVRGRFSNDGEKHTPCFFFQVIHPDALGAGAFACGRSQTENVRQVLVDVLGHGNEGAVLPGQPEAENAALSARHGGFLLTAAELAALNEDAAKSGAPTLDPSSLLQVAIPTS